MDLDLLGGVSWSNGWRTDAFERMASFLLEALESQSVFPSFDFNLWTEGADQLAIDLAVAAYHQEIVHVDGGPFGGGDYFVVPRCDGKYVFVDLPKLGQPASFMLMLAGKPKGGKWLTETAKKYKVLRVAVEKEVSGCCGKWRGVGPVTVQTSAWRRPSGYRAPANIIFCPECGKRL